ncbi:MAG TPA: polyphosphate kinase [Gemmatimonas aurantiaca]|uniref:Polyphosphate kinase n=2 Tax=Gemmatimonas aurantiaca TaxID=173480 RepID=A0A3D4V9M6_9BACT|nr:polyphosphate kinase [Gemmatimonas aurantiaca]
MMAPIPCLFPTLHPEYERVSRKEGRAAMLLDGLRLEPVDPDARLSLGSKAAEVKDAPAKAVLEAATAQLLERLHELQDLFHADGRYALLVVFQGRDASGKDGVIRTVCGAFNPTGVQVSAFGPPTALELRHDFLWRVHQVVPPRGVIGVFNRSHYEDVLAVRVRGLAPEDVWRARYDQINAFEQMLAQNRVIIRKCFLHVSRDEQRAQLQERLDDPTKNWKFRLDDLEDRARWDAYTEAYRDALTRCTSDVAPWYVVPSDRKSVRNYLVARMLVETLESLPLEYPRIDDEVREAARDFK